VRKAAGLYKDITKGPPLPAAGLRTANLLNYFATDSQNLKMKAT